MKKIRVIHKPSQNRNPEADKLLKALIKTMQERGREAKNGKENERNE